MEQLLQIITVAILVEAITKIIKDGFIKNQGKLGYFLSIAIGQLLAITTRFDVLLILGLPTFLPYVGIVLTGLLVSRGANFVNDIFEQIGGLSK